MIRFVREFSAARVTSEASPNEEKSLRAELGELNLAYLTVYEFIYNDVDEIPEDTDNSLKGMVGAKGFEPSTSWSRTIKPNSINASSGVAYGTRKVISPLLVVPNLYLV
jgi:hypothetical protein